MSGGTLSLVLGTVLALGALSYVLWPLLSSGDNLPTAPAAPRAPVQPEEGLATVALREIEFDRATGKLSDEDYDDLMAKYSRLAEQETRIAAAPTAPAVDLVAIAVADGDDPVEAAVRAVQARRPACRTCGPRPESDATYCSGCGHFLPGACRGCGADVSLPGARFCHACGVPLAA